MPVTISYDLQSEPTRDWNYLRSMFERFGWTRVGASVFRYEGRLHKGANAPTEDWLNEVVPAIMLFRSYIVRHAIVLKSFTLNTDSATHIDLTRFPTTHPLDHSRLHLHPPTNQTASEESIRAFVKAGVDVIA